MDAPAYNKRQMLSGRIGWEEVSKLVSIAQEHLPGYDREVDGKIGPETLRALHTQRWLSLPGGDAAPSELAQTILRFAIGEIGNGEEYADNSGPHVAKYRGISWDPDNPRELYGHWCAYFISWCARQAYRDLDRRPALWCYTPWDPAKPEGGAKRLVRRAGEHGSFVARRGKLLATPIPGDLVSLDRGKRGSPAGHVFVVERWDPHEGILHGVDGNRGSFACKVKRGRFDLDHARLEDIARV